MPERVDERLAADAVDLVANKGMKRTEFAYGVEPIGDLLIDGEFLGDT